VSAVLEQEASASRSCLADDVAGDANRDIAVFVEIVPTDVEGDVAVGALLAI